MGNPIQEWLDKFSKLKPTVSAETTVGTGVKPNASGKESVKAGTSKPVIQMRTDLQQQKEAIAKKTNREIINAAYKVVEEFKLRDRPRLPLRAAEWDHLTDNRSDLYKDSAVDEIEILTLEQKTALKRELGFFPLKETLNIY
jgi:hypothetical protein